MPISINTLEKRLNRIHKTISKIEMKPSKKIGRNTEKALKSQRGGENRKGNSPEPN